MNLSCSTRAIKYLMFLFNFLFVVTGITLIAVGASIKSNYKQYDIFLDSTYFSLPNLLIATGILIFIISFLGCYGAMKESWIILMAFSFLLGIIFIFEFSAGIAGYVLRDKTSSYLTATFHDTMKNYKDEKSSFNKMWDLIQSEFQCCGVMGPFDWNQYFNSSDLPISCCPVKYGAIGHFRCNNHTTTTTVSTIPTIPSNLTTPNLTTPSNLTTPTAVSTSTSTITTLPSVTPKNDTQEFRRKRLVLPFDQGQDNESTDSASTEPFQTGCEKAFGNFVRAHAVDIGAVGFALAFVQIIGIAFSFHLARQLKNQYYST